ncbi:MAG TPA: hypothetical protein DEG70_10820, partial [Chloroflexi bacterium]|nr:hypothetical protein [Chloroflexota bacterium]
AVDDDRFARKLRRALTLGSDRAQAGVKQCRDVPVNDDDRQIEPHRVGSGSPGMRADSAAIGWRPSGLWLARAPVLDSMRCRALASVVVPATCSRASTTPRPATRRPGVAGRGRSHPMRIVRNTGYIKRRKRAGKLIVAGGLGLLIGSWVITLLYPSLFLLATAGLAVGFIFFNGGMQQLSRWSRRPRNDEVIDADLNRLNDRYTIVHYPDVPGRRPDHVLIMPNGVLALTSREVTGSVKVKERTWRKLGNPLTRMLLLGGPQLGNPTIESEEQIKALTSFLETKQLATNVTGAIVFVADKVEVDIENPTLPVLHAAELHDYVRQLAQNEATISTKGRDDLAQALSQGEDIETNLSASSRPKKKVRAA